MVCPIKTQGNLVSTIKFAQTAGEGNLQGRRIINTTEKINAIKEQYGVLSDDSKEGIKIILVSGITLALGGLLTFYYSFPGPHVFPVNNTLDTLNTYSHGNLIPIGISVIGLSFGLGILLSLPMEEMSRHQRLKDIPQNLNDEQFLNWAEYKKVELDIHNVEKYHSNYKEIIECLKDIDRLQSAVINTIN
ncbi:MAG TPA: hypothetical protein VGP47_00610 [Parachlamydiaceae bacterium]|nr:hypothetical protein [Parachlamydiaceae bacterium]